MNRYPYHTFVAASPESEGVRSSAISAMLSAIHAENKDIHSMLLWRHGKLISGDVTPEFVQMLLSQPKPADAEIHNKMTPFFNVFLDDKFQSCHYGTELYL